MGCISSKRQLEELRANIFEVTNIDDDGNEKYTCQLEITDVDIVLHQPGKNSLRWPLRTLRRYGFDSEHFSFESGRRCPTGPGIYAFRCKRAEELFNLLQTRIQIRNRGDNEIFDLLHNAKTFGPRNSMCLEPYPFRRTGPGIKCSVSLNGETIRLSSVMHESRSAGPLSPQSAMSSPVDSVPLIPPLPVNRSISQTVCASEDIPATVTKDLEETNNNKTCDETVSSPSEHSYLNSIVLDSIPRENVSSLSNEIQDLSEEGSSPMEPENHLYMNIIPGTDIVAPFGPENLENLLIETCKTLDSPKQANSKSEPTSPQKDTSVTKTLNYIVLDLEPTGNLPKSPTTSLPPDIPKKSCGGYAAIDFQKTVALSHSINPIYDTDSDGCRKTRHSSNINVMLVHERHNSSVSD